MEGAAVDVSMGLSDYLSLLEGNVDYLLCW